MVSLPVRQLDDAMKTLTASEEIVKESIENKIWIRSIKAKNQVDKVDKVDELVKIPPEPRGI